MTGTELTELNQLCRDIDQEKEKQAHEPETVEHPHHYTAHPSGIECIDVAEHMSFNIGNAVKYLWRVDLKDDPIENLRKARWYITRELERRSN